MDTVGDVLEFWHNWCSEQNIARHYGQSVIENGEALIVEDAQYWADRGMWKLLDSAKVA